MNMHDHRSDTNNIDTPVPKPATPVANPFIEQPGYNCFACAPHNACGLQMNFQRQGNQIICHWEPQSHHQGYNNVLHGGVQATLLDEISSWTIYVLLETAGVTADMKIEYHRPVWVDRGTILICAQPQQVTDKMALIKTELYSPPDLKGTPATTALCRYRLFSDTVARRRLAYPGAAAFIPKQQQGEQPTAPTK